MIPIVLICFVSFCQCNIPDELWVLNMDSQMECCDEESEAFADCSGVTVGRFNETIAYMYGAVKFLKDIDDGTMVEIILEKEASGKYELMFSHEICDLCAEVRKGHDSDYYGYMKYFGVPEECPFPAGDYPIKEFILDTNDLPVNSRTAGRYNAFVNLYKNPEKDCKTSKEFMCCLNIKLVVEMA